MAEAQARVHITLFGNIPDEWSERDLIRVLHQLIESGLTREGLRHLNTGPMVQVIVQPVTEAIDVPLFMAREQTTERGRARRAEERRQRLLRRGGIAAFAVLVAVLGVVLWVGEAFPWQ